MPSYLIRPWLIFRHFARPGPSPWNVARTIPRSPYTHVPQSMSSLWLRSTLSRFLPGQEFPHMFTILLRPILNLFPRLMPPLLVLSPTEMAVPSDVREEMERADFAAVRAFINAMYLSPRVIVFLLFFLLFATGY